MKKSESILPEQILELADAQCSGIITEVELAALEQLLTEHPEYRREYLNYVFLHIGLASAAKSAQLPPAEAEAPMIPQKPRRVPARFLLIPCFSLLVCLCAVGLFLSLQSAPQKAGAPDVVQDRSQYYFDENAVPPSEVAFVQSTLQAKWELLGKNPMMTDHFQPGTVKVTSGNVDFAFSGGADVSLTSPSLFGMEGKDQGTLFSGKLLTHRSDGKAPFKLETPSVELINRGTEYEVSVNEESETYVHVLDGQVEVKLRGRLPRFYWNFDQRESESLQDAIGMGAIRAGKNAVRVEGIIGSGAIRFNNHSDASLLLGNGGGKEVGTGDYAVSTGVTIEAMVISEWEISDHQPAKKPYDYDEIFRKEDGSYRIFLSFQNDNKAGISQIPVVEGGPCLSFGLFLTGMGYNELDMPLDGKEGRPTLAEMRDGKPHHIVATYNGWTGVKAIYIDGKLRMSHRFPVGTMIISGGATPAVIGNLITSDFESFVGREPFSGVIDEVAFYDYALDPATIAAHFECVKAGRDYFEGQLNKFVLQEKQGKNMLLNKGQKMKFSAETGKPVL